MKLLTQSFIFMFGLIALWVSHALSSPSNAWWQSLLQNFGAGLFSALVVIWLYDRVLEREHKRTTTERNRVAASQLVAMLRSHIYGFLFPMYRSAVAAVPEKRIKSWQEFLTSRFADQMQRLDVSARSPGSYPIVTPYPKFISDSQLGFHAQIQSWLDKYGAVVDSDLVDALEQVCNSNFSMMGRTLEQFVGFVPPGFPPAFSIAKAFKFERPMCQDYGAKLTNLIEVVENKLAKPISKFEDEYWHNACLEVGYARRPE